VRLSDPEAIFPYSQQPKRAVDCPVCGTHGDGLNVHDRYGYPVTYVQCKQCSMGYLGEQMTREGYDRFYAGGYRALINAMFVGQKTGVRTGAHQSITLFTRIIPDLIEHRPCASVLDAGGSVGAVGQAVAATMGASVTVLDPAAQELPDGVATIRGYLEDPIPGHYDLAICVATSDHLTDPIAALRNLRQCADLLVIDFIDIQMKQALKMRFKTKIDHPLYWTSPAMQRALRETGWMPWRCTTIVNPKRQPRYLATMMSCR
jgi:methyltransferase family protein